MYSFILASIASRGKIWVVRGGMMGLGKGFLSEDLSDWLNRQSSQSGLANQQALGGLANHQHAAGLGSLNGPIYNLHTDSYRYGLIAPNSLPSFPGEPLNTLKKVGLMNSFRAYLDKHRDTIFTVALVFLADHYILGGALKERLRRLLEGLLTKAENSLHKELGQ